MRIASLGASALHFTMPSLGQSPVRGSPGRVALKLADAEALYKSTLPEINERAANHVGRLIQHRSYLLVTERPALRQQLEDRPLHGCQRYRRRPEAIALCAKRITPLGVEVFQEGRPGSPLRYRGRARNGRIAQAPPKSFTATRRAATRFVRGISADEAALALLAARGLASPQLRETAAQTLRRLAQHYRLTAIEQVVLKALQR